MSESFRSRITATFEEVQAEVHKFGFPVELVGAFVLGGWRKKATTEAELQELITEVRRLSPLDEVTLYWGLEGKEIPE